MVTKNLKDKVKNLRTQSYNEQYSTLELIEDLKIELSKYSEELATLFSDRLINKKGNAYSHSSLAQLIGHSSDYISNILRIYNKGKVDKLPKQVLVLLKQRLENKLNAKALGCMRIIKDYKFGRINVSKFVDRLEKELGRVSGEIGITDKEISLILVGTNEFFHNKRKTIKNPKNPNYYPDYKFDLERLECFKKSLKEIWGKRALKCIDFINRYQKLNPDLKHYPHQQFQVEIPHYFRQVSKDPEASYWYGFWCADGSFNRDRYGFYFELKKGDRERIEAFAKVIGLSANQVKDRVRYLMYKGKFLGWSLSKLQFICRPMADDFKALNFQSSNSEVKEVPNYVKDAIHKAKQLSEQIKIDWWLTEPGRIAFSWLLGFYDGDGSLGEKKYGSIFSNNKQFLEDIKRYFEINNKVCEQVEPGELRKLYDHEYISKGMHTLNLGHEITKRMMYSYSNSMQRKRHIEFRNSAI